MKKFIDSWLRTNLGNIRTIGCTFNVTIYSIAIKYLYLTRNRWTKVEFDVNKLQESNKHVSNES